MSDYPSLKELGINSPQEIDRYSLETINNIDVLRVVYRRQKNSLLPDSKKFRFNRTEKPQLTEGGSRVAELIYEISPFVRKVMGELDQIVRAKHDKSRKREILQEELHRLEEETAHRIAYIKRLIGEI